MGARRTGPEPQILWTYRGRTQSIEAWSVERGIPYSTLYSRYFHQDLALDKVLGFTPMGKRNVTTSTVYRTSDGRAGTMEDWVNWTGRSRNTLYQRVVTMKLSPDEAFELVASNRVRRKTSDAAQQGCSAIQG